MKRPRRSFAILFACVALLPGVIVLGGEPAAPRASLLRVTVDDDPSREPRIDEITALVLLGPGVERVQLEIQAVDDTPRPAAARPAGGPLPRPEIRYLEGEGDAYRGPDGRFRLTATASRPGGDAVVKAVVRAPHSALRLRQGQASLRYTVTGRVGGEEVFFASTRSVLAPRLRAATPQGGPPAMAQASPQYAPAPPGPAKAAPAPSAPPVAAPFATPAAPIAPGPRAAASPFATAKRRTIHFATNRDVKALTGTPSERFGDRIGDGVRYGSCPVNLPTEARAPGTLPLPAPGTAGDPAREFFILRDAVRFLEPDEFRALVRGADGGRDVLVYVHGFNTSFDFAMVRMAQVVTDLEFAGLPVVFSWPAQQVSVPWPSHYSRDEANADRSYGALARVLKTLVEEQDARPADRRGKIHVLAHSLGNRVTMRALSILDTLLPAGARPIGQVVLAAPDVSTEEFARLQPTIERRAERVSLYFNPNDRALWASFAKHGRERRAGNSAQFLRRLDNIDAANADTSLLGHGYWSEARTVLLDLRLLVTKGWEPARRVPEILRAYTRPQPYWGFPAERRFGPISFP